MWVANYLSKRSKGFMTALGLTWVWLLWIIDYKTDADLSIVMFYLIPISFVTWYVGHRIGVLISIASAIAWFSAEALLKPHYFDKPAISYWNVTEKLGFFLLITYFLSALKRGLVREKDLARTDYLTEVSNGRAFSEAAEAEIQRTHRYGHPFSVAYLDVDNFKSINDTLGHNTGDALLRKVAQTTQTNIRSVDVVARLGGDEFVILLPETNAEDASVAMIKVKTKLCETMAASGWHVTFSIGLATYMTPPESFEEMMKKVDDLMYSVKLKGKNNIRHEVEGMEQSMVERA